AAPRGPPARRGRLRARYREGARPPRRPIRVARRALHLARSPRRQGIGALDISCRRRRAQRSAAAALHGDAGRPGRAARIARQAAREVARRRASVEGADVVSNSRLPAAAATGAAATPPRAACWLLRRTLPRGERGDTVLGDLIEEWHSRGPTRGA